MRVYMYVVCMYVVVVQLIQGPGEVSFQTGERRK